jgi:16S rRNA (guanine966-N2)-methyltransferase
MRITAGRLKNRTVPVADRPGLRPTSARVREAVFHVLGARLEGARVWDAFGGSGILAFEAWSRGAVVVVCTERDRRAVRQIAASAARLGAAVDVRARDASRVKEGSFDVIFADPPYADDPARWISILASALAPDGLMVFEHRSGKLSRGRHGALRVTWQRKYGDTTVSFLARPSPESRTEQGTDSPLLEA